MGKKDRVHQIIQELNWKSVATHIVEWQIMNAEKYTEKGDWLFLFQPDLSGENKKKFSVTNYK